MNEDSTRRVFFAAQPSIPEREVLENSLKGIVLPAEAEKRLRWLDTKSWHVTLRFVGDVTQELVTALLRHTGTYQPFSIHFDAIAP